MSRLHHFKAGRLPSPEPTKNGQKRAMCAKYRLDNLGPAPSTSAGRSLVVDQITGGNWQIEGNDTLSLCVEAAQSHAVMLWTAVNGNIVIPSQSDTVGLYSAAAGYNPADPRTDRGSNMMQVAQYCENTGYMGVKLAGVYQLQPDNLEHLKWTILLGGVALVGVSLPYDAETQFNAGQPWSAHFAQRIMPGLGGHGVTAVDFDSTGVYLVSWGKKQFAEWDWYTQNVDEVYGQLSPEWINAAGTSPGGLTLQALAADLQEFAE